MDLFEDEFKRLEKYTDELFDRDNKRYKTVENDRALKQLNQINTPTIPKYFENSNIFITGGSGFMGKALIEKLLRSCSGLNKIYLLLRAKKGRNEQTRLDEVLNNPIFDRLKQENPSALSKVHMICGDCEKPNLGLSNEDAIILTETVDIVYHMAASVRFDDPLTKSILMNVRSTRDVVFLSKQMKHLKVFVHVSTCYCNVDKPIIDEIVYPRQGDWRKIILMAETFEESKLRLLESKILNKFPNTYTFTKSIAENLVDEECKNIPTVIFRPSIVIGSISEPVPGWIDSLHGPAGLCIGFGIGLLHTIYGDGNCQIDYLPVDKAINSMIVSTWYQAHNHNRKENQKKCLVINASTSNTLKLSNYTMLSVALGVCKILPTMRRIWYPFVFYVRNKILFYFFFLIFHLLPGFFIECLLRLTNNKFHLMKLYRNIYVANIALNYFLINQWVFRNGNFRSLNEVVLKSDIKSFDMDFLNMFSVESMKDKVIGYQKYLLKEDVSIKHTLKARSLLQRFFIAHCVVIVVYCLMAFILILQIPFFKSEIMIRSYLGL